MFTLSAPVEETIKTIEVKLGDQGFTLSLRPVSDEERTRDSALVQKFFNEDDPGKAGDWFIARNELRASCVIDWEGVLDPEGKPIKFTAEAFKRVMTFDDIRAQVIGPVNRHFERRLDAVRLGESAALPTGSTPDGSGPKNSPTSSDGTQGGSQPAS